MMRIVCITADCRVLQDEEADIYRVLEASIPDSRFFTDAVNQALKKIRKQAENENTSEDS
jgi:hypothetical protein